MLFFKFILSTGSSQISSKGAINRCPERNFVWDRLVKSQILLIKSSRCSGGSKFE